MSDAGAPAVYGGELAEARRFLSQGPGQSDDFYICDLSVGGPGGTPALLAYFMGIIDNKLVDSHVVAPIVAGQELTARTGPALGRAIAETVSTRSQVRRDPSYEAAQTCLLEGGVVLFVAGVPEILLFTVAEFPHRAVDKPETEHSVRGSREGFGEHLMTNLTMVRRRLKHPNIRVKLMKIGRYSETQVAVMYVEGLANPEHLQAAVQRLQAIDIDIVPDSHTLEEFLVDHPYTPFPLIRSSERPDEAVKTLVSGKVLIFTDNTPFVLGVPSVLMDFYQTTEDYTFGPWAATFVRLIRLAGWGITFFLPGLYIALIAVNPELVPNELALTVAHAREGLPFPPIIEVWIIETLIEMIREAALRLPQPLGITIGVVGGTVVGQAIVVAGVISPLMIIVAAVTMIASFTTPTLDMGFSWRILKWLLIFLAHAFGLLGLVLGAAGILGHLASLSSFGVPYLSPFSPLAAGDLKDTVFRSPLFSLQKRPQHNHPLRERRLAPYRQPAEHPAPGRATHTEEEQTDT